MDTRALTQTALHLPQQERAQLAQLLLDSLDGAVDVTPQEVWLQEAARRASDIDEGRVQLVSAEDLERQVQALLR